MVGGLTPPLFLCQKQPFSASQSGFRADHLGTQGARTNPKQKLFANTFRCETSKISASSPSADGRYDPRTTPEPAQKCGKIS